MGIRYTTTILLFCFLSSLWAQQYEVAYKLDYKPNLLSDTLITEHTKLLMNSKEKISFYYNIGSDETQKFYRDINEKIKKYPSASVSFANEPNYNFAFAVHKDFGAQRFTLYDYVLGQVYAYEYPSKMDWILENDTKEILQYTCQKAKVEYGGRSWIAWFTNEIPVSDGPYKFSGLPGLILEIYATDNTYHFIAETLDKATNKIVVPKAIPIGLDKLKNYKGKLKEKPRIARQNLQQGNMSIVVKFDGKEISQKELIEDFEKEVFAWLKNYNNPIEIDMIWLPRK